MPWAAGTNPGQPASPRRGKGSSRGEERGDDEEKEEEKAEKEEKEKETTFIEASSQLRARPLSPLVVHSRGEEGEDEGGEEEDGEGDSSDYSTEETPVVRILKVFILKLEV